MTIDINDQIAEAKGWTRVYVRSAICGWVGCEKTAGPSCETCELKLKGDQPWLARACIGIEWIDPKAETRRRPNFTGTLEGMAGMMRELGPEWEWCYNGLVWECYRGLNCGSDEYFTSPDARPGHCVGEALLSVLRKEA